MPLRVRRRPKLPRAAPLTLERELWAGGVERVAGIDEAGRGPLAGPVVAAAVVLPPGRGVRGAIDSKRLTPDVREQLVVAIRRRAVCIGVGMASPREIDRLNILRATHLAMRRALERLPLAAQHVIVDGLPVPSLGEHTAVVDGDAKCQSVACASIVAKVVRDRLMRRLDAYFPGYGWETNVGYGTPEHVDALLRLGPTPHHRISFSPLQLTLDLDMND